VTAGGALTGADLPSDDLPDVAPVLRADGLVLRPWRYEDADQVLVLAADAESRRWSPSLRTVDDLAAAEAWIANRLRRRTDWAVEDAATGRLVARIGLHHHDPEEEVCEVGYGVWPAARRRGVASRALETVLAYGFAPRPEGLGRHRVNLMHFLGNVASCRVAWSHGFAYEGVARDVVPDGHGGYESMHLHARLSTDPPGPIPRVVPAEPVEIAAGPYQLCVPDPALDAAAVAQAHADPEIAVWNPGPTDLDGATDWVARRADWSDGMHASWLVKSAVGGTVLGSVSVHQVDGANLLAEVGYWVAPQARGQGVGTAALSAATRFAFGALGLNRLEILHAVENVGSHRLAERVGYRQEGVHRQSFRTGDGVLRDEHSHARLAADPEPEDT
jgi:RimJ/RimL family protein N-acetyltransferase